VGNTQPIYDNTFTTRYESIIAAGIASFVEDMDEKSNILARLCKKYLPGDMDKVPVEMAKGIAYISVVKIKISSISGKRRT